MLRSRFQGRMISAAMIDGHSVMRWAVGELLAQTPDIRLIGSCADPSQAVSLVKSLRPDVVIAELVYADATGFSILEDLHARQPRLPVLVYSALESLFYVEQALRLHAKGYVAKSEGEDILISAIRHIHAGGIHVPDKLLHQLRLRLEGNWNPFGLCKDDADHALSVR